MYVFQVVMSCLEGLVDTLSFAKFDFWNGDTSKNFWSFVCTFCGAWIVLSAMYKRWKSDGKGWG